MNLYFDESKDENIVNWMKLTRIKYFGPKKILNLFSIFKSLDKIMSASNEELVNTGLFSEKMMEEWRNLKTASNDNFFNVINECKNHDIKIITIFNELYPERLKKIPYPPLILFLMGNFELLKNENKFAIAGSRNVSESGIEFAYNSSKKLSDNQYVIVSGVAKGVDTAAHKGAIDSSFAKTIVIMGSGFFRPYPEENISLFDKIREKNGLLISEHLPKFAGSRISYLQRNRIISGISKGLLLCASDKVNGGSATQMKIAHSQGIPIFCPSLDLNILPNEGIKDAIEKYNMKQITDVDDIINLNQ